MTKKEFEKLAKKFSRELTLAQKKEIDGFMVLYDPEHNTAVSLIAGSGEHVAHALLNTIIDNEEMFSIVLSAAISAAKHKNIDISKLLAEDGPTGEQMSSIFKFGDKDAEA